MAFAAASPAFLGVQQHQMPCNDHQLNMLSTGIGHKEACHPCCVYPFNMEVWSVPFGADIRRFHHTLLVKDFQCRISLGPLGSYQHIIYPVLHDCANWGTLQRVFSARIRCASRCRWAPGIPTYLSRLMSTGPCRRMMSGKSNRSSNRPLIKLISVD